MNIDTSQEEVREQVRARYAAAARSSACCGDDCCGSAADVGGATYDPVELAAIPAGAASASLGCGNPTAVADLHVGETVLDLGSGAGIDVLLSARRVGPTGFVYGLDMTDEMLELARRHQGEAGVDNVEFLRGHIEDVPLGTATVDVVISNCVVNLSVDKDRVFAEMRRVLRPGGRIGITDIVADDSLTPEARAERGDWVGCIAGALSFAEYRAGLERAGFEEISLTVSHAVADGMYSAIVRATKPSRHPVRTGRA